MCAVFFSALPQAHIVSAVCKFQFFPCFCRVCFIVKSLPSFAASNIFVGRFAGCTLDRKPCLDLKHLVAGI